MENAKLISKIREIGQCYVSTVSPRQTADPSVGNIARRFSLARQHAKLTLLEVSKRSKCAMSMLSGVAIGDRMPRIDSIAKIARALGVSPAWLAYGEGKEPDWLIAERPIASRTNPGNRRV